MFDGDKQGLHANNNLSDTENIICNFFTSCCS